MVQNTETQMIDRSHFRASAQCTAMLAGWNVLTRHIAKQWLGISITLGLLDPDRNARISI